MTPQEDYLRIGADSQAYLAVIGPTEVSLVAPFEVRGEAPEKERTRSANFIYNFLVWYSDIMRGVEGYSPPPRFHSHITNVARMIAEVPAEKMNGQIEAIAKQLPEGIAHIVRYSAIGDIEGAYSAAEKLLEEEKAILALNRREEMEEAQLKNLDSLVFVGPGTGP